MKGDLLESGLLSCFKKRSAQRIERGRGIDRDLLKDPFKIGSRLARSPTLASGSLPGIQVIGRRAKCDTGVMRTTSSQDAPATMGNAGIATRLLLNTLIIIEFWPQKVGPVLDG